MAQWSRYMRPELEGSLRRRVRVVHMTSWAPTLVSPYTIPCPHSCLSPVQNWERGGSVHQPLLSPFNHLHLPGARKSGNWTTSSEWEPQSLLACLKETNKTKTLLFFLWDKTPFPSCYPSNAWKGIPSSLSVHQGHTSICPDPFVCKVLWHWLPKPLKSGGELCIMMLLRGKRLAKGHTAHEWKSQDLNSWSFALPAASWVSWV